MEGKNRLFLSFCCVVVAEKPLHTQDKVEGNIRTRGISSKIVAFSLRLHFFVIVFIHESNWQSVFPAFSHVTMLNTCCCILSWLQLLNCITNEMQLDSVKAT